MNRQSKLSTRVTIPLLTVLALSLVLAQRADAYIDPGTGSMIAQMVIAGLVAGAVTVKMWWYNVKAFFARLLGKESAVDAETADEPASVDD